MSYRQTVVFLGPLRAIVGREAYTTPSHPHGASSVELRLLCGHVKHVKGSKAPRAAARCIECR